MSSSLKVCVLRPPTTTTTRTTATFTRLHLTGGAWGALALALDDSLMRKVIRNETNRYDHCFRRYHQVKVKALHKAVHHSLLTLVPNNSCNSISQGLRHLFSNFHKYRPVVDAPPGVFKGFLDRFNGITVQSKVEYEPDVDFRKKLEKSLEYWINQKRRAIWFEIQTQHSDWVPELTKLHFDFHHAKSGVVVLARWLPQNESDNLPMYAHTMLGVGGLVVNQRNEVLVVSERYALIPDSWKIPGGYAEPGENLIDACIREVREETGIDCDFNTVISIRHSHGGCFGCSDIYVVIGLTPKTLELRRCEREISKLQWMPVNEYLQHPHVHETNRHFLRTFLDYQERGIRFTCDIGEHKILKKKYCLYYMKPNERSEETKSLEQDHNVNV